MLQNLSVCTASFVLNLPLLMVGAADTASMRHAYLLLLCSSAPRCTASLCSPASVQTGETSGSLLPRRMRRWTWPGPGGPCGMGSPWSLCRSCRAPVPVASGSSSGGGVMESPMTSGPLGNLARMPLGMCGLPNGPRAVCCLITRQTLLGYTATRG